MKEGIFIESKSVNPYENLALEEYLLNLCTASQKAVLYLWQNDYTVVIGRNQNAFTECDIEFAKKNGIHIARRLTGGGAVFHDLGNVNYTMILPKEMFDVNLTTKIIVDALNGIGIKAEKNGRNDICTDHGKISGNAYYSNEKVGLHHGTILYRVNKEMMGKVLRVSDIKLSKKGIKSVRSRVGDIISDYPGIELTDLRNSIKNTFYSKLGMHILQDIRIEEDQLQQLRRKYESEEWNMNRIKDYEVALERVFSWGIVRMSLLCSGSRLCGVEISTDSLDVDFIELYRNKINLAVKDGTDMLLVSERRNDATFKLYERETADLDVLLCELLHMNGFNPV